MRRRILLLSPLLLAAAPETSRAQPAGSTPGTPLTPQERATVLPRIEAYLNGLSTLKARFLQIDSQGRAAQGTAWIARPGRMRFEYDPPEPILMVASHGQFFYFDKELNQPSVVPTSSTPLGILLRDNLKLSGDLTVAEVTHDSSVVRVTLYRTASPGEGRLTLVFNQDFPITLKQWVVLDAQGRETRVSLSQVEQGGRFDPLLFEFNDPRFREQLRSGG